jgi:hypothetical protein
MARLDRSEEDGRAAFDLLAGLVAEAQQRTPLVIVSRANRE